MRQSMRLANWCETKSELLIKKSKIYEKTVLFVACIANDACSV